MLFLLFTKKFPKYSCLTKTGSILVPLFIMLASLSDEQTDCSKFVVFLNKTLIKISELNYKKNHECCFSFLFKNSICNVLHKVIQNYLKLSMISMLIKLI